MIKFKNVISDRREIVGILITTFGFLLLLGLFSYDPLDVKLYTNNTSSSNWIGLFEYQVMLLAQNSRNEKKSC